MTGPSTDLQADVDRLLDDRVRQGLPRRVTDPTALARIAAVLRDDGPRSSRNEPVPVSGMARNKKTARGSRPEAVKKGVSRVSGQP